jgi:hypothetical protein
MMRLLRVLLLAVMSLLMVATVVVGIGSENTGALEKAVLVGFGILLLLASFRVQKIGRPSE